VISNKTIVAIEKKVRNNLDIMTEIFVIKDPLLRSSGPISLYYWFISNTPQNMRGFLREFIIDFEDARRRNKNVAAEDPDQADELMLAYDLASRSVDSKPSLISRYEILQKRFEGFVHGKI